MKYKIVILSIILASIHLSIFAQSNTMVGKMNLSDFSDVNDYPQLTSRAIPCEKDYQSSLGYFSLCIESDSTILARFLSHPNDKYQRIPYIRREDTLILYNTSYRRVKWRYRSAEEVTLKLTELTGTQCIVKIYKWEMNDDYHEFHCTQELKGTYDTTNNLVYIHDTSSSSELFVIIDRWGTSMRFEKTDGDTLMDKYLEIDLSMLYRYDIGALFDSFPIIVRHDSIIPIDNNKNFICWVDNGFYFPILTANYNHEHWPLVITKSRIGVLGLGNEFNCIKRNYITHSNQCKSMKIDAIITPWYDTSPFRIIGELF